MGTVITVDFGRDTSCRDAVRTTRFSSGLTLVAERCYHRLITPRGQLRGGEDEANFGIDLPGMLGRADDPAFRASLPGKIRNELLKDECVTDARAKVTRAQDGTAVTYTIEVECDTGEGPFEFVLAVADVTPELLKIILPEAA